MNDCHSKSKPLLVNLLYSWLPAHLSGHPKSSVSAEPHPKSCQSLVVMYRLYPFPLNILPLSKWNISSKKSWRTFVIYWWHQASLRFRAIFFIPNHYNYQGEFSLNRQVVQAQGMQFSAIKTTILFYRCHVHPARLFITSPSIPTNQIVKDFCLKWSFSFAFHEQAIWKLAKADATNRLNAVSFGSKL